MLSGATPGKGEGGKDARCGHNGSQRPHFEYLGALAPDIAKNGPQGPPFEYLGGLTSDMARMGQGTSPRALQGGNGFRPPQTVCDFLASVRKARDSYKGLRVCSEKKSRAVRLSWTYKGSGALAPDVV